MEARRPTSADVAARAGVSRTTVSFVLNDRPASISPATRERVLEAARELGYHPHAPARQLAGGSSHTLGLVLRQSAQQVAGDALLAETLRGVTNAARARGFRVIVEALDPNDGPYADLLRSGRADGVVISGPRLGDRELEALVAEGFPVVLQGSLPGLDAPSVDIDNRAGAKVAVAHLLSLGHRRIGCITNAPLAYTAAQERLEGYEAALREAGIEPQRTWIAEGAFDAPSGHRAMTELLGRSDLDAVFVASDVVAFGAIGALRSAHRRVPEDISVVGFDDIPLAAFFDPPLTTVHLPAYELGHAVGEALLDRISRAIVPRRTLLPTELVVRASTRGSPSTRSPRRDH
ncbi:MAG TPA: LacI family DNA-binding transcriptional regulator [Candidatus Limnocylindrales bacterium]|jgi:LacI family transcriptional regulator